MASERLRNFDLMLRRRHEMLLLNSWIQVSSIFGGIRRGFTAISRLTSQLGYQIVHHNCFLPGKVRLRPASQKCAVSYRLAVQVFKVLWSEPMSDRSKNARADEAISDEEQRALGEQKFYVSFCRFIVVAKDEGHCTCVYLPSSPCQPCASSWK
jgi:hypothetical protein